MTKAHLELFMPFSVTQITRNILIKSLLALLLFIPVSQAESLKTSIQYVESRYVLGPGDVLNVTVMHEPDYSQEKVNILPDGYASIKSVGDVKVGGLTVHEAAKRITAGLEKYIVSPEVVVSVTNTRPSTVYLQGAVIHPGMYQMATTSNEGTLQISNENTSKRLDMRITNVLANSGGVKLNADLSKVVVKRNGNDSEEVVNLLSLLQNGDVSQDIIVNSGDTIIVPELPAMGLSDEQYELILSSTIGPQVFPVRVMGHVKEPGVYELGGQTPYLNSAIAKAGGYSADANQKIIAVRRLTGKNKFSTILIDANKNDFTLRPNDFIYIAESNFYKVSRSAEQVSKMIQPFYYAGMAGGGTAQTFGFGGWKRKFTGAGSN
jgi:protein involved in polysaccharide export with SLBB domain